MFSAFAKRFFRRRIPASHAPLDAQLLLDEALRFQIASEYRAAQKLYLQYLQLRPYDTAAMNELACCLASAGDEAAAEAIFEKAHALDDSNIPVAVNYASVLRSRARIDDAAEVLIKAQIQSPALANISNIFAATQFSIGNNKLAREFALKGWLSAFDDLRLANCFLFNSAYADIDERLLASEHRFWAKTLKPSEVNSLAVARAKPSFPDARRIKIGYWSPDLRSHSVRLFFRPLLEAHDKSKFETFVFHDSHLNDEQTALIEQKADHFIDCSLLTNGALTELLLSQELDVLMEMAGHSSTNRITLLQQRLATLQISGIGYPPTTGLSTIDVKLLDKHIATDNDNRYYTESSGVLDSSFWCFDPKEDIDTPLPPPFEKNGFITFGCVGNIAKITPRILNCWAAILAAVPTSRLLLRAINFNDPAAERNMRNALKNHGVNLDRVEFKKPAGSAEFYRSYNEIDILLDTYPFNGGTTSCFATYMGVPIVSLAGKSLLSRMGKSILENLKLGDWVVEAEHSYVDRAIEGARNVQFLRELRLDIRTRYSQCALGNGKLFAEEFEKFILQALQSSCAAHSERAVDSVEALAEDEIVRRAHFVYACGQIEAGRRIVDHCLDEYPASVDAKVLWTERLTSKGNFAGASDYLIGSLSDTDSPDAQISVLINAARLSLLAGDLPSAQQVTSRLQHMTSREEYKNLQIRQLCACFAELDDAFPRNFLNKQDRKRACVVIASDSQPEFEEMRDRLIKTCEIPDRFQVIFKKCVEGDRCGELVSNLKDLDNCICVFLHKNIRVFNVNFWFDILDALKESDIVGVHGAFRWEKLDWDRQPMNTKAGSVLVPCGEKDGYVETRFYGNRPKIMQTGLEVLRGHFLAIKSAAILAHHAAEFDVELCDGGVWMEELFTWQAQKKGCRLAVHQALGVMVDWRIGLNEKYIKEARLKVFQTMEFPPVFDLDDGDERFVSVAIDGSEAAASIQRNFVHS